MRTTNQQNSDHLFKVIFDGIPAPIFVVDDDVQIHIYNAGAAPLLEPGKKMILRKRGGEALHCLHSEDVAEGCGRGPICKDCVIRNAVRAAFQGDQVICRRHKLELIRDGNVLEIYALITASPIFFYGQKWVLLVIEDISELVELKRILPICAKCKKVRNDENYWVLVESYFKKHLDMDFSHGLCPDCYKNEIEALQKMFPHDPAGGND